MLPDGSLSDDIDAIGQNTSGLGATIQGVAQVQLLTLKSVPLADAEAAAAEVLEGISNLFEALGVTTNE